MANGLFDCTGKVAVVTGGNSGIGLGFARGIAKLGGDVAIWGRSADKLEKARADLASFGVRVIARAVDVSSEDEVVAGYEQVMGEFGRVDCVFANAGGPPKHNSVLDMTTEGYRRLLATNMDGAFFTLREGARRMVTRAQAGEPGGSLVFCGSLSIFGGIAGKGDYAAAKAGMAAMIRCLAVEFGKYAIRANTVAPGWIKTEMMGDPTVPHERDKLAVGNTPISRPGYAADFEGIGAYLCSDASSFHSGDTIVIDGGKLATL